MGFEKQVTAPGHGSKPVTGQKVTVHWCVPCSSPTAPRTLTATHDSTGYGKNRDLAVPFWSTKDAGQQPFSFVIGVSALCGARALCGGASTCLAAGAPRSPALAYLHLPFAPSLLAGRGSVIKAWDEGVATMQLGEKARITATPDYAYGAGGFPAWGIMPNSPLIFDIEVLSIA